MWVWCGCVEGRDEEKKNDMKKRRGSGVGVREEMRKEENKKKDDMRKYEKREKS